MKVETILTANDRYNLLTGNVPMLFNRFLSQQFKLNGTDLTREQWSVIAPLWKQDGCSQQVIADFAHRDKPNITRLIDNLENEGYVERRAHPTDRRQNLIFLTHKGKEIEKKVMHVVNTVTEKATKGLSEAQIIEIKNFFRHIQENIQNEMI
ncbi:MAG: MarR family transcriptional regulator [Flavobacterium psychrophilum]|nr:MAG: MarR family transcriptional regulator [Flavobacterium psychrophilum]